MEEKKIVGYLAEELSERGVFVQDVSINYDDKFVIYSRGVEKTEIIDGEVFVGRFFAPCCTFVAKDPVSLSQAKRKGGQKHATTRT